MLALSAIAIGLVIAYRIVSIIDAFVLSDDDPYDALLFGLFAGILFGIARR